MAVVAELFALWQKTLPRISGKSKLAEALPLRDLASCHLRTLSDRRPHRARPNIVERAIRPQAITRNYAKLLIMRRLSGSSANNLCFTAISKAA
ncbi:hypothetical protein [Sinorhizobium meliloti]|uniref:hypothetical protein n=1 Tax=Rhizobium meliloti TaxID=382 RepID=UPI003B437AAB